MSITYPLSIPAMPTPQPSRVRFSANNLVAMTVSAFTFAQQVQKHDGDGWYIEVTLPPMQREDADQWVAFISSLQGKYGTFQIGDPLGRETRGNSIGSPKINGGSQTGYSVITDGWTPSTTGALLKGDKIQIGTRLHMIQTDVDADGSGNATLDIWPRLRESPADNETIIVENPVGLFRLSSNQIDLWEADSSEAYSVSFAAVEAL